MYPAVYLAFVNGSLISGILGPMTQEEYLNRLLLKRARWLF